MNSKQKGNAGIGAAIAYFTRQGYNILIPLTDSQDYDIVVDMDGLLNKVQVKYTTAKAPSGNYTIPLRSMGGTKGVCYKTVIETDIDYLFCVTQDNDQYLVPIIELSNKNTITLSKEFSDKYKV
jgi:hypothetical protein